MERRTFLARIVQSLSLAIAALFAFPIARFIAAAFSFNKDATYYPIANAAGLQEEVTRVAFTRLVRDGWMVRTVQEYVWVRKKSDGSIVVFEPHCTHLGCAYSWNESSQQFLCPCHGGKFDKDGNRLAGPPPRPLDQYHVRLENREIKIGKIVKA